MIHPAANGFTVVIPAYNPGSMLREALESVAQQTVRAAWVTIIDDGSSDGTFEAANAWLAELSLPGEVLRQPNQGISAARNAGLANRRTQTVALLDADDLWMPHHLSNLARAFERWPEALVVFGDSRFFGDPRSRTTLLAEKRALAASEAVREERFHLLSSSKIFDQLLPGLYFAPSAAAFRMDSGPPEPRFETDLTIGEDRYLFLQLARRGPFVYVHDQSCRSRRHETNTTHSDKETWLREQSLVVLEKIRHDPGLALSAREQTIVAGAQQWAAQALLYASSLEGVGAYRRARRLVAEYIQATGSLRDLARAVAVTTGLYSSRSHAKPPNHAA